MKETSTDKIGAPIVSLESRVRDILVVEDNAMLRNFIVGALLREGYHVISAATAEEAERWIIDSMNTQKDSPYFDVIISDDQLGDGMGSELLLHYRRNQPPLDNTYMLLMSGTYRDEKKDRGLQELKQHSISYLCKGEGNIVERIKERIKTDTSIYFAEMLARKQAAQKPEPRPLPYALEIPTQPYRQSPQTTNVPPGPITLD